MTLPPADALPNPMYSRSPFTDVAAVRAWDTWFRWRESGVLRDRTIESTWWRVARAISSMDGAHGAEWARRYYDAFAHWQLLPDERLLREAGTDARLSLTGVLRASVNARAFVRSSLHGVDLPGITEAAYLAVRLLADARRLSTDIEEPAAIRVGLLGVGDALNILGVAYDSEMGRTVAADIAKALGRGVRLGADESALPDRPLTSVARQPHLACLANGTSDALDPARTDSNRDAMTYQPLAQWQMRRVVQPWIDDPIDYPLAGSAADGDSMLADRASEASSLSENASKECE